MDDLKCKKAKVGRKKTDLLIKLRKKLNKQRKSRGKENLKLLKGAHNYLGKGSLGKPRRKASQVGPEGMFFKGLRSEYITRACLNEANEARKKEDLNKIIDIGRDFVGGGGRRGRDRKRDAGVLPNQEKWPGWFGQDSSGCADDFELCSLSPISVAPTHEEHDPETKTTFDLEKEFEQFSLKYEKAVESEVLLGLPEEGVLEEAIGALRKKLGRGSSNSSDVDAFEGVSPPLAEGFKDEDSQFLKEFKFSPRGSPDYLISPEKIFVLEGHGQEMEKPFDGMLIMTDIEEESYYHPSFSPGFDKVDENENLDGFHFEKPSITTPPIQFHRRNMF